MANPFGALLRTATDLTVFGLRTAERVTTSVLDTLSRDERFDALRREWSAFVWSFLDAPVLELEAPERKEDDDEVRTRFAELLRRSSDIYLEDGEPALVHVVEQLSPDEARIVRVLHHEGPVPVAKLVRQPLIGGTGQVVLSQLSMVADRAGCRHPDRCAFYITNLERLGIVELLDRPVEGHGDYGLIEGRADYIEAGKPIREDRTVRVKMAKGQMRLTSLGRHLGELVFSGPPVA